MGDTYDLKRFEDAQNRVADSVSTELRDGLKRGHWMWFVFPQVKGLGMSATSQRYAIQSLDEARAFLEHPVLGERLREWTRLVLEHSDKTAEQIFGYPDYLKFRSCMTLFSRVESADTVFAKALEQFYGGKPDQKTLDILGVS
jgi:uncharacterized protein (DUF1810 family)